jgi:hypothetical protein
VRWFGRLLGWFVIVDALITIFGESTGPLLLSFAADGAIGLLIIRSYMENRAAVALVPASAARQQDLPHGDP